MEQKIIDLHCDTMMSCYFKKKSINDIDGHINLEKLEKGEAMCQALALFIPTDGHLARDGKTLPWDLYKSMVSYWHSDIERYPEKIRKVLNAADIEKNRGDGVISALLSVEDGIGVDGKMERLREMYSDGVRMLTLTWNYENCFGYPNSSDPVLHKKGLKPFGIEAVGEMEKMGMIVDVSHLSEGGFYDVAKNLKKPFVASHSCARALCNHQRNLTDDQLKTLAERGGIVGVNFYSVFLTGTEKTFAKDIVRHMAYIRKIAGIDVLAIGSDFDGIESSLEFKDFTGIPLILDLMSKEFTDDEIDKISSGNFLRVAKEIMKK